MRIGDWSSDVCSSDLADAVGHQRGTQAARADRRQFLGDDEAVEIVEAGAVPAIFFGITQPEDTGFGRLLMQFARQFALGLPAVDVGSSDERRVGKECVSTCRSRWSTVP